MSSFLKVGEITFFLFSFFFLIFFLLFWYRALPYTPRQHENFKKQKFFWEALISTFLLACWLRHRYIIFSLWPQKRLEQDFCKHGSYSLVLAIAWCAHTLVCATRQPKFSRSEQRTVHPELTCALCSHGLSPRLPKVLPRNGAVWPQGGQPDPAVQLRGRV